MDKTNIQEREERIVNLIADFCAQKLNEEYLALADRVIKELAQTEPVPFMRGKPEIWAAGIIHALGSVNWMFDRSNKHYTPAADINSFFGTNGSTTSQKAMLIKDLLDMQQGDREFSTQDTIDNDPFAQFVMLDDMIVPMSMLSEELQQQVKLARAEGKDVMLKSK